MTNSPSGPIIASAAGIDLRRLLRTARRSVWMIVACPVIAALVAGAVSTRLAPVSHEELMAEGGLYSELFNLQARAYLA